MKLCPSCQKNTVIQEYLGFSSVWRDSHGHSLHHDEESDVYQTQNQQYHEEPGPLHDRWLS